MLRLADTRGQIKTRPILASLGRKIQRPFTDTGLHGVHGYFPLRELKISNQCIAQRRKGAEKNNIYAGYRR